MAAGLATLQLCAEAGFYESLQRTCVRIVDGLVRAASDTSVALQGQSLGGMMGVAFADKPVGSFTDARSCDHAMYARFFHAMLDRGVFLPPSGYEAMFVSSSHDDDTVDHILGAAVEAFALVAE